MDYVKKLDLLELIIKNDCPEYYSDKLSKNFELIKKSTSSEPLINDLNNKYVNDCVKYVKKVKNVSLTTGSLLTLLGSPIIYESIIEKNFWYIVPGLFCFLWSAIYLLEGIRLSKEIKSFNNI